MEILNDESKESESHCNQEESNKSWKVNFKIINKEIVQDNLKESLYNYNFRCKEHFCYLFNYMLFWLVLWLLGILFESVFCERF